MAFKLLASKTPKPCGYEDTAKIYFSTANGFHGDGIHKAKLTPGINIHSSTEVNGAKSGLPSYRFRPPFFTLQFAQ